eukprot:3723809-Ditylum_brightwellii.AAC.1
MGIIGYDDIGQAVAKLADAYGMNVVVLQCNPTQSMYDLYVKKIYDSDEINALMSQSDYIVITIPLMEDTCDLIGDNVLSHAKEGAALINVGRGTIIEEYAMMKGATEMFMDKNLP